MIVVNRNDFIAWSEGVLLDRTGGTINSIGDNSLHETAEAALERGETIALTIKGVIVTHMKSVDGVFQELVAPKEA